MRSFLSLVCLSLLFIAMIADAFAYRGGGVAYRGGGGAAFHGGGYRGGYGGYGGAYYGGGGLIAGAALGAVASAAASSAYYPYGEQAYCGYSPYPPC